MIEFLLSTILNSLELDLLVFIQFESRYFVGSTETSFLITKKGLMSSKVPAIKIRQLADYCFITGTLLKLQQNKTN